MSRDEHAGGPHRLSPDLAACCNIALSQDIVVVLAGEGGWSPAERGTRDCGPCRDRQRAYQYRGVPDLPPRYTVIEIGTGTNHSTWDNLQEVAGALAYATLTLDDVELQTDAAPMAAFRSS